MLRRRWIAVAAVVLGAALIVWLVAGRSDDDATGAAVVRKVPASGLTGQFLVATPQLTAPPFDESVIFMIADDEGGAMGLMVNRVFGHGPLRDLLAGFGVSTADGSDLVPLHYGGPVMPRRGFVLHGNDYAGGGTRGITDSVFLSTGADILRAMAENMGPRQRRVILGYAGWAPGQLDAEIARGDWLTAAATPALIFDDEPQSLWRRVYRHAGQAL